MKRSKKRVFLSFFLNFCIFLSFGLVFLTSHHIKNQALASDDHTQVFSQSDDLEETICKHVEKRNPKNSSLSKLFENVKDVYIFNSINHVFAGSHDEQTGPNTFEEDNESGIEIIAACALYKNHGIFQNYEKFGSRIFTTNHSRWSIKEIQNPGNLSIFISGYEKLHKLAKQLDHLGSEQISIFVLQVTFYRSDFHDEFLSRNFCAFFFTVPTNQD